MVLGKRDGAKLVTVAEAKRAKYPAYFMPQLAHVIAVCDERVPFAGLIEEVIEVSFHCFQRPVHAIRFPMVSFT